MSKYHPTKIDLANGWLKVKGCMLQTFAHYLWRKHFKPSDGDSAEYRLHEECHIVERGTLVSVLLNIRVLDDFFGPGKYPHGRTLHHNTQTLRIRGLFLSRQKRGTCISISRT